VFSKPRKTRTDVKPRSNDALRMGIVVCFLVFFQISSPLYACDMSAFVQSDFASRCQELLDLFKKSHIAWRVAHPDKEKHAGNLSREWVRFFLAHGNAVNRPPSFSFIASSSWESGINELGASIAEVVSGKTEELNYELTCFRIQMLKDVQILESTRNKLLEAGKTGTNVPANLVQWVEQQFIGPGMIIAEQLENSPMLLARLEREASEHFATAGRIDDLSKNEPVEIVEEVAKNLKKAARNNLGFWQRLFFCCSENSL